MINFKNFSENNSINENVQQAKIFLKKRLLASKKSKTGKELPGAAGIGHPL